MRTSSSRTATSGCATAIIRLNDSEMRVDGLFSLGFPRDDGGEEMNARIRVVRRDVDSLRHAFGIDEYPVSGLLSGEFQLTGEYLRPVGLRRHDARQSGGVRRAAANGDRVAAVRRHRRPPRRSDGGEGRRHHHRRRVRRMGLDLFVQPRWPADSARAGVEAGLPARSAVGHRRVLGERQRHLRSAAKRLPVPGQRPVRRRRGRRPGDRLAGASRHRADRRDRRGVAAARDHGDRAHRRHAAGRLGDHRSLP